MHVGDTVGPQRLDPAEERRFRRAAAFACTRPLHRLEADKGQVQGDLAPYPLDQLALDAIELVALSQEFQDGLSRDELVEQLADRARRHAPERSRDAHKEVAQRVVADLLAAHQLRVPELASDGRIGQVVMTLRLLSEHEAVRGRIYLRAGADGQIVGLDDEDLPRAVDRLAMLINDWIRPPIDCSPETVEIDGAKVVIVMVPAAAETPYGVGRDDRKLVYYVRRGATSAPARPSDVRAIARSRLPPAADTL